MAAGNDNKGSLNDFSFDTNDNWFDIDPSKVGESQASGVVKEVKSDGATSANGSTPTTKVKTVDSGTVFDEEDDDDDDKSTFFGQETEEDLNDDDEKKKPKKKKVAKSKDNPDDLEEEDDDEKTNLDDKSKKGKEDEDEEEDDDDEKDKGGKKGSKRGSKDGDDEDVDDEDKDENPESEKVIFSSLTKDLVERGFLSIEVKDEIDTEEKFFDLIELDLKTKFDEAIEDFSEKLDDDGKRFLKFKKEGGNTQQFLAAYASPVDLDNFDEKDERQVQAVLVHYLTSEEGLEGDELQDRLDYYKTGGKERAMASKFADKLVTKRQKTLDTLQEAAEKARKKKLDDAEKFDSELVEVLEETEQVGMIPVTKTDHKELKNFFNKPTVKVGKNRYIPEFQAKLAKILQGQTKEDKQKLIALGKIIKEDFVVKDLAKDVTTKVVKKVKSNIKAAKVGARLKSSGSAGSRQLSDFF